MEIFKQIEDLQLRINKLSTHLIAVAKQKDFYAKRSIAILINRKKRLQKWWDRKIMKENLSQE